MVLLLVAMDGGSPFHSNKILSVKVVKQLFV